MFLFGSRFSGLVPFVVAGLEGSDASLDTAGCSLVTVISRLLGNDDMTPLVPRIVEAENA